MPVAGQWLFGVEKFLRSLGVVLAVNCFHAICVWSRGWGGCCCLFFRVCACLRLCVVLLLISAAAVFGRLRHRCSQIHYCTTLHSGGQTRPFERWCSGAPKSIIPFGCDVCMSCRRCADVRYMLLWSAEKIVRFWQRKNIKTHRQMIFSHNFVDSRVSE